MSGAIPPPPVARARASSRAYRADGRAQTPDFGAPRGARPVTRPLARAVLSRARSRAARRGRYNEWILCLKKTDNDEDGCKFMRQYALSLCPDNWIEKWDEEREEFPEAATSRPQKRSSAVRLANGPANAVAGFPKAAVLSGVRRRRGRAAPAAAAAAGAQRRRARCVCARASSSPTG